MLRNPMFFLRQKPLNGLNPHAQWRGNMHLPIWVGDFQVEVFNRLEGNMYRLTVKFYLRQFGSHFLVSFLICLHNKLVRR